MQHLKSLLTGTVWTRPVTARAIAAAMIAMGALAAPPAHGFELFGMKFFESEEEAEAVVDPLDYTLTFEAGTSDSDLEDALRDASILLADEEKPVSGSLGLISKARSERELLIAALYSKARYEGLVEVTVAGRPIDAIPPDADFGNGPVPVSVRVQPGDEFRLGDVMLRGDAAGLSPAEFGLVAGSDAGSGKILQAESDIVRRLKEEGRPLARVTAREIVADHNSRMLDVTIAVEAGPVASYGETSVEGTEAVDRDFTAYMAGLERGETYDPKDLEEARERLVALDVFDSVSVAEGEQLDGDGALPIAVTVSERKHRYVGGGISYSNTEGAGIEAYWGHRNLFGRAEKLRIQGSISRIGDTTQLGKMNYNAAILFEKPGVLGPASKFNASLEGVFEHPDAYDRFSVIATTGVAYELTRKQTVSGGLKVEWSKIEDAFATTRHLLVSIPLEYVYDGRDNRLNPTSGFRFLANAEPTYDIFSGATFLKLKSEASAYYGVDADDRFVLAGRVAGGSILGAPLTAVPADRRFYSGGGGSVRGYAYQGIGPRDANGTPTGGLSYAETSVEMRIKINDSFGIVPFVDAGTVSTKQFPDFSDVRIGAGLGIRYLTPFGPLRIDAAVPINRRTGDPRFGIYAGIGQAF